MFGWLIVIIAYLALGVRIGVMFERRAPVPDATAWVLIIVLWPLALLYIAYYAAYLYIRIRFSGK